MDDGDDGTREAQMYRILPLAGTCWKVAYLRSYVSMYPSQKSHRKDS
jgi:hypothetical protein